MTEHQVRWGRVVAHAVIALVAGAVLGGVAIVSFSSLPSYESGYIGGKIGMIAAIATGVASYFVQSRARTLATIGATLAAIALGIAIAAMGDSTHAHPALIGRYQLSAADHVAFIVDGNRLRHPTLGFSIAAPPADFVAQPIADAMAAMSAPESVTYAWSNGKAALLLQIMPSESPERTPDENLAGLRAGIEDSIREQRGSAIHEVVLASQNGEFHARFGRPRHSLLPALRHGERHEARRRDRLHGRRSGAAGRRARELSALSVGLRA